MSKFTLFGDAKASAREGDVQRKHKALNAAQERQRSDPSAVNRMAVASALFDLGRFAEAEKELSSLKVDGAPDVLFELGFIYKNLGRKDEAIAVWKRLAADDAKHPLARAAENEIWRLDPDYKPSWLAR